MRTEGKRDTVIKVINGLEIKRSNELTVGLRKKAIVIQIKKRKQREQQTVSYKDLDCEEKEGGEGESATRSQERKRNKTGRLNCKEMDNEMLM